MRQALLGAALGLAVAMSVIAFAGVPTGAEYPASGLLRNLELKLYDWRLARTARPEAAPRNIVLVEIDEESLRALEPEVGRWPWPRAVHAMLVRYLSRAPARVIAFDVNFASADCGGSCAPSGQTGPESDRALVDAVRDAGNVIVVADTVGDRELEGAKTVAFPGGGRVTRDGILERQVLAPFEPLGRTAARAGHNMLVVDEDGTARHAVPFVRTPAGTLLPALGVQIAAFVLGVPAADLRFADNMVHVGDRAVPLWMRAPRDEDDVGHLWTSINFRGGALLDDQKTRTYRHYSIVDLVLSEIQIAERGETPLVDPVQFRDAIVVVGATASGLHDTFETPFARGKMPGAQLHAAIADDILSRRPLRPARPGVTLAVIVISAVTVGVFATTLPPWWAAAASSALALVGAWIATMRFADGYWVNITMPGLGMALALFAGVTEQYFVEGREKKAMRQLFGRFVPRGALDEIVRNPAAVTRVGHTREMTVLFADLRGFTAISETRSPEEVVSLLNGFFEAMVPIIFQHGGAVDKFVGDMVMAMFGAPLTHERHAQAAVDTALAMVAAVERMNEQQGPSGPHLKIGVGINTGHMVAGVVGARDNLSYTVIGDAVNVASRLQEASKVHGSIVISDATLRRLPAGYATRPCGAIAVRGLQRQVGIHSLGAPGAPAPPGTQ